MYCTAGFIVEVSNKFKIKKLQLHQQQILPFVIISAIGIFGFISTILLITTYPSSFQIKTAPFVAQYLYDNKNIASSSDNNNNDRLTIISSQIYSWIFRYVFDDANTLNYRDYSKVNSTKYLLILDNTSAAIYLLRIRTRVLTTDSDRKSSHVKDLQLLNKNSKKIATFKGNIRMLTINKYPYSGNSMAYAGGVRAIIRTGELPDIKR